MRVLKYIFRIDYPVSYSLIDKLGDFLDYLHINTNKDPYKNVKNNINISSHIITSEGDIGDNKFVITLSVDSFNGELQLTDSSDFNDLLKCQLFSLVQSIIERMRFMKGSEFKRIGLRIFAIDDNEKFKFDKILKYMLDKHQSFVNSLSHMTSNVNDVALTLESINPLEESYRLVFGPYQDAEKNKYFSFDPNIKEGLMFDFDTWQPKISIPELNLIETIKQRIRLYSQIMPKISQQLLEEL